MPFIKIAFRNIFRHKTRSIITLSTIVFGCIALIFIGGFFEDVFFNMRESYIHGHTGHIQIFRKGFFEKGSAAPFDYLIDNPQEIIQMAKNISGVRFVTPRIEFSGLISTGDNTVSLVGQGIEPENESAIHRLEMSNPKDINKSLIVSGTVIEEGASLEKGDLYDVIMGKGLASGIGAKPQDGLILVANTVGGSINALDVNLKGVFYTSSKIFDDHFIKLPIATVQKLLHTDAVQSLVVMLERTEDTKAVQSELKRLFNEKNIDAELKTWDELSDFYGKTVILFNRMFFIIKLVIIIVVILSIFNTMNMAVLERTVEIGTIMAMGTRRYGVLKLFLAEGLGLGLIGGSIGVICGIITNLIISRVGLLMPPPPNLTIPWISRPPVVPDVVMSAFLISLITALISSFYPAYKAARLEIAEALRHV